MNWVMPKLMCVVWLLLAVAPAHAQDVLPEQTHPPAVAVALVEGMHLPAMEYGEQRLPPCTIYCPHCGACYACSSWPEDRYGWHLSSLDRAWREAQMKELLRMIAALVEALQAGGDSLRETQQR